MLGMFMFGMTCEVVGRWMHRIFLPKTEDVEATEIAQNAANRFGVCLHVHSFSEANIRFRKTLLVIHPDRFSHESDDQKAERNATTRDILACWVIVRTWYIDNGHVDTSTASESYVKVTVLKTLDTVTQRWNVTRTWRIGDTDRLERDLNPDVERLDEVTIYL